MLDGIILKAGTLAATIEGRAVLSQCAEALNSPFAKEYVLNAAGVGKVTLEEGTDIANMAIEIVEKNPKLLAGKNSVTEAMHDVTNDIKTIKQWTNLSIDDLKSTQNFKPGALKHVLEGELNGKKEAVGFHYEGMPTTKGSAIIGTEKNIDQFGVYEAKVEVNGIPKISNGGKSTFFPKHWSPQQVVDAINEAFDNKQFVNGTKNTYVGKLSNGMKIQMYIDNATNKIISAFPVK
jgi:hypothetical protein